MTTVVRLLDERPPAHDDAGRLGRHVEHDPRSRAFGVRLELAGALQPVVHRRHGGILDQGDRGSCTGNALVGALNSEPLYRQHHVYREGKAVLLYRRATQLDSIPGEYPPDDTGSSGLAVCKAALELGLLTSYRHAFGIVDALRALQLMPVITGVTWYEGFDRPDSAGRVTIAGQARGGHEFVVRGFDPAANEVLCDNSWSPAWGIHGSFRMPVPTWATLLEDDGDVTIPIR